MGLQNTQNNKRTYVNISSEKTIDAKGVEISTPKFRTGSKGSYEYFNNIEGLFRCVSFSDGEFENAKGATVKTRNFELILDERGGEKEFYIKGNLDSGLGRDIFNKLSSVENLGLININLFLNKSGFFSSRCMNNGVDLNRKLSRPEQDELITKVQVDDKTIKGFKKLNEVIESNMMLVGRAEKTGDETSEEVQERLGLNDVDQPNETPAISEPTKEEENLLPF